MTNRRDFLKLACGAAGFAAFEQGLDRFGLLAHAASAAPPNQYRALVCIFMFGGNDANNMVIPVAAGGGSGYTAYANSRGGPLAIPAGRDRRSRRPPDFGLNFGLHPAMPELKALFNAGKLAVVTNVGPLTRAHDESASTSPTRPPPVPALLAQRPAVLVDGAAVRREVHLRLGRTHGDVVADLNTGTSFPASLSLSGNNQFNVGQTGKALNVAPAPTALNAIFPLNGFAANAIDNARKTAFNSLRTFDTGVPLVKATSDITQQGLDIQASLATDPVVGTFPATGLGNQLKQVAKIIKQNQMSLNVSRQVFFCSIGGFDTHQDELTSHTNLYGQISKAMSAFYAEMVTQGLANNVTTFTMSDFGRTMAPSGSGASVGSDHAWGSHQLVMGGAIKAGELLRQRRTERHAVPRPRARDGVRHGRARPVDPDDGRRPVRVHARPLARRDARRAQHDLPEPLPIPDERPRVPDALIESGPRGGR